MLLPTYLPFLGDTVRNHITVYIWQSEANVYEDMIAIQLIHVGRRVQLTKALKNDDNGHLYSVHMPHA